MHGAAAFPLTRVQHSLMHAQAVHSRTTIFRQQRGVQVNDALRETRDQRGRQDAEEAGEHYQICGGRNGGCQRCGKIRSFAVNEDKRHGSGFGVLPAAALAISDDGIDARGNLATCASIQQGFEIAAAAGNQDGKRFHIFSLNCRACRKKAWLSLLAAANAACGMK